MLTEIDHGIWIADGPTVRFLGIYPYPTRMTMVRLSGGGLWVCSPIQLSDALSDEVKALGSVQHLVSPNMLHHLFLAEWVDAWPEARLWAPPFLARRRRDLSFDGELTDAADPAWEKDIDQLIFRGSFALKEVVFFHRASRSVILTDLVQKFDPASLPRWLRPLYRLDGLVGPDGSTPREVRLTFWNRRAARESLRKALAWDPQRLIIAHGEWVRENGKEELARSFAWIG
jgi:hypothetical protein